MTENVATSIISLGIQIEVVGSDLDGMQFIEPATTHTITRDGATLELSNKLAPESELVIRNVRTGDEALARVVGQVREAGQGHIYGIALMSGSKNIWHVQFPPESMSKPLILECGVCGDVARVSVLDIEAAVFQVKKELARDCERCGAVTIWKQSGRAISGRRPTDSAHIIDGPPEDSVPYREKRMSKRAPIKSSACIRHSGIETVVGCEDMSRGGFRFLSEKQFREDLRIEASVPYVKSGLNIFTTARIIYSQELANGAYRHGVSYIKTNR